MRRNGLICLLGGMVRLRIVAGVVSHVNHQMPPPLPPSWARVTQPCSYRRGQRFSARVVISISVLSLSSSCDHSIRKLVVRGGRVFISRSKQEWWWDQDQSDKKEWPYISPDAGGRPRNGRRGKDSKWKRNIDTGRLKNESAGREVNR